MNILKNIIAITLALAGSLLHSAGATITNLSYFPVTVKYTYFWNEGGTTKSSTETVTLQPEKTDVKANNFGVWFDVEIATPQEDGSLGQLVTSAHNDGIDRGLKWQVPAHVPDWQARIENTGQGKYVGSMRSRIARN